MLLYLLRDMPDHSHVHPGGLKLSLCKQVIAKLRDFVEEERCRSSIVLLPSVRDVHHDLVFPQPPFESALPRSIHTLTNPATFRVNEITIGGATHDVLKQVGAMLGLSGH